MGAHPRGASRLLDDSPRSLLHAIDAQPYELLGARVVHRFGPRLPFLFKVLAAAAPLSIQAHPSAAQARAGFDREEAAGLDREARTRCYRDPFAKPELLCAIEPFVALSGFRPLARTRRLIEWLGVPRLRALCDPLWSMPAPEAIASTVAALLTMVQPHVLVDEVAAVCRARAERGEPWSRVAGCAALLAEHYPGDPGMLVALLLNRVRLQPDEALFVGPGRLHCYLEGLAVELMGSSDNVLRGGLTQKHVDVPQLVSVLETEPVEAPVLRPTPISATESVYETDAEAFALSRIVVARGRAWHTDVAAPQIVLCTSGRLRLADGRGGALELSPGASAFVSATTRSLTIEALDTEGGDARCFRATVGGPRRTG